MKLLSLVVLTGFVVCFSGCGSSVETAGNESAGGLDDAVEVADTDTASDTIIVKGSYPLIAVVEKEIDIEIIDPDASEVTGTLFFFNNGGKPLQIRKISGPCNCFAGYSGDKLIQPGDGGAIDVRFDKSKLPMGESRRLVRIETNDPKHRVEEVYFTFNIERDPMQEELRLVRSELRAVRHELHLLQTDIKKLVGSGTVAKKAAPRPVDTTVYAINIGDSPTIGPKDAPVTIVAFTDLQCPYCVREYPKLMQVVHDYQDKVQIVFKHRPLAFHKKAKPVHAAVELAKMEGGSEGFWKMHDLIMAEPKKLEVTDLHEYAETLGLDMARFDKVMADAEQIDALLKADRAEADKCKVRGTPTILVNGLKMTDRSIEGYKKRIDGILANTAEKGVAKAEQAAPVESKTDSAG